MISSNPTPRQILTWSGDIWLNEPPCLPSGTHPPQETLARREQDTEAPGNRSSADNRRHQPEVGANAVAHSVGNTASMLRVADAEAV
jgi:hypothetical protein